MSSELFIRSVRGSLVDAHIYLNGQIFNNDLNAMENYASGNYVDYAVPLTEQGDSGVYEADFPSEITTAGVYQIIYVRRVGALPVETTDIFAGTGSVDWDGSAVSAPNPLAGALITTAQAKAFMSITLATEDDMLDDLIVQASEVIQKYCDRRFGSTSYTEYYNGNGKGTLFLRNYPIIGVTSLHNDVLRDYGSDSEIDVTADVLVDKTSGILTLWNDESVFTTGVASIKAIYSAGYVTIPEDVQEACLLLVQHTYKRFHQEQKIGVASETIGNRTTSFASNGIPKRITIVLNRYKKQGSHEIGYDL